MKWYWWVVTVILALNGLLIAMIGLALAFARVRKSRAARAEADAAAEEDRTKEETN
jgi:mannose/fructose/N-acetylgalactosamine-specific phosphotransferase system component IIC